ncbi:MAG: DUF1906 domain-containing protein [Undibacterium sp.]|nr:DUF1906 domain-containing protein [Undibacterium sp.]
MTTLKGLDTVTTLTPYVAALKQQGFNFAMRYYSHSGWKNLSLTEAQALSNSGIQIGVVWESAGTQAVFFTQSQGKADAQAAYKMATAIGQPMGSAIYFAVDYDATNTDLAGGISDYFSAVQSTLLSLGSGTLPYQVGVYGSGLVASFLLQHGLVSLTWLSQSTGFSGSLAFAKDKLYNLIQTLPTTITANGTVISIDPDASNASLPTGLFTLPTTGNA